MNISYQWLENSSNPSVETSNTEVNIDNWKFILDHYDSILQKQFYLAYLANIPITDSDEMNIHDFEKYFELFVDMKNKEKESIEKAYSKK